MIVVSGAGGASVLGPARFELLDEGRAPRVEVLRLLGKVSGEWARRRVKVGPDRRPGVRPGVRLGCGGDNRALSRRLGRRLLRAPPWLVTHAVVETIASPQTVCSPLMFPSSDDFFTKPAFRH